MSAYPHLGERQRVGHCLCALDKYVVLTIFNFHTTAKLPLSRCKCIPVGTQGTGLQGACSQMQDWWMVKLGSTAYTFFLLRWEVRHATFPYLLHLAILRSACHTQSM
jgi:hypothetical protein